MNGVMEQRQAMGLDPFAPPCTDPAPDRGLPPAYPLFVAKRAVEHLLQNEELFRNTVRVSAPTGSLQLPPEINPSVFTRWAERADAADAEAWRVAGRTYVRAAYDANELISFAYGRRSDKRASDAQVIEYVNGALAACRKCREALDTVVPLLPREVVDRQLYALESGDRGAIHTPGASGSRRPETSTTEQ